MRRRRLARAAHRDVAETDDVAAELFPAEHAQIVARQPQIDQSAVNQREHIEHRQEQVHHHAVRVPAVDDLIEEGLEILHLVRGFDLAAGEAVLLHTVEEFVQENGAPPRRALVFVDNGQRLTLHARALLRVRKKPDCRLPQFLLVLHGDDGVPLGEQRMDFLEVDHVVADDDGLAVGRRLQDIVPAVGD